VRRYLDGKVHPAVTGTFITRKLVRQITRPGDLVVDPMAGCGSILVGAVREGRRVWGSEIIPEYAAVGNSWLTDEQAKSPFLAARHPDSKETPHD
jgi:DNA modification methylase